MGMDEITCPRCRGRGISSRNGVTGTCAVCGGSGKIIPLRTSPHRFDEEDRARLLAKLNTLWGERPNERLCQLLVNISHRDDPFYLDDAELEALIDAHLEKV